MYDLTDMEYKYWEEINAEVPTLGAITNENTACFLLVLSRLFCPLSNH